jgi:tetratricopeptide (TPR) repeat protein
MRIHHYFQGALLVALTIAATGVTPSAQAQKQKTSARSETVPVTTQSAKAREAYETGMRQREDLLYTEDGLQSIRDAVKADPHFALAHAAIAYFTVDPAEEKRERTLSISEIGDASPDEKLLIRWMNGTKNGQLVPAIAAMNDLLAKYPNDKRLANLDAEWLCSGQQNYERGEAVLEAVLKADPNYFPALNNIAYCYALGGKVNLAPPFMDRYVLALPNQPNPQDSYAEILRMAGDFQGALDHYRAALKIDPAFFSSQVGIASTYALMGDQERARAEYPKAIEMTKDSATKLNYRMLWALTYYRENRSEEARKAFTELAAEAHNEGFPVQEAESHRTMALFNTNTTAALADLDAAQIALSENHVLSHEDHDTELATILQTRAFIAARAGMPNVAQKALEPLAAIARTSRNNLVQQSFHSASGAVLFAQGKYAEAISEFQYDPRNPLSLELLADAQSKNKDSAEGQKTLESLAAINDERVETAFAAPPARAALKSNSSPTAQATGHIGGPLK